jgi:methylglyoxal synthase
MLNDRDDDHPRRWRVALYADEIQRPGLEGFAARVQSGLAGWDLRAPGVLAAALEGLGLRVRPLPGPPRAAIQAIAADLASGELDALIVLRDAFAAGAAAAEATLLLRLADLHQVATATNLATAECLVRGLAPRSRGLETGRMAAAGLRPMPLPR